MRVSEPRNRGVLCAPGSLWYLPLVRFLQSFEAEDVEA